MSDSRSLEEQVLDAASQKKLWTQKQEKWKQVTNFAFCGQILLNKFHLILPPS